MPIASFSARRLDGLLARIAIEPTIGTDMLREIASQLGAIGEEMDSPTKQVLVWVLTRVTQSLCEKYDGEPMTAEESAAIARFVHNSVQESLRLVGGNAPIPNDKAIELMVRLIARK